METGGKGQNKMKGEGQGSIALSTSSFIRFIIFYCDTSFWKASFTRAGLVSVYYRISYHSIPCTWHADIINNE